MQFSDRIINKKYSLSCLIYFTFAKGKIYRSCPSLHENDELHIMKTISITICDEHRMMLDGLLAAFKTFEDIQVLGVYKSYEETIEGIIASKPDIAIIELDFFQDYSLAIEPISNISILQDVMTSKLTSKVIILSNSKDINFIQAAINLGAVSFLTKSTPINILRVAIDAVHAGNTFFTREIKQQLEKAKIQNRKVALPFKLTNREKQVLGFVSKGYSTPSIAEELNLHKETISDYRESLMKKLRAKNAADLIRISYESGIL
jgi:DNA-binding NarL/FixJ family response regulator